MATIPPYIGACLVVEDHLEDARRRVGVVLLECRPQNRLEAEVEVEVLDGIEVVVLEGAAGALFRQVVKVCLGHGIAEFLPAIAPAAHVAGRDINARGAELAGPIAKVCLILRLGALEAPQQPRDAVLEDALGHRRRDRVDLLPPCRSQRVST